MGSFFCNEQSCYGRGTSPPPLPQFPAASPSTRQYPYHINPPGYYLVGVKCLKNHCKCQEGGTDLMGPGCPADQQIGCGSCSKGFTPQVIEKKRICKKNKCLCGAAGEPLEGPGCPAPGGYACQSCNPGFTLNGKTCTAYGLCTFIKGSYIVGDFMMYYPREKIICGGVLKLRRGQ